jgi:predicted phage terminase large subunit-like protein
MRKLNPQEHQLLVALESEISKRSLFEFFKLACVVLEPSTKWDFNWHFKYVADILQSEIERIIRGEEKTKDYVINLPFRSGKSMLISIITPVWGLIKDPTLNIICVSSTMELATKFSHKSKILIESEWFVERFSKIFELRADSKSKANFITNHGGSLTAFGITGSILGSGCDLMLLDDVQSPSDATPAGLKSVIEVYQDIIYSRLNNPSVGLRLILQQRVNINDISGYLMRTHPDKYKSITIPAILTEDLTPPGLVEHYVDGLFWGTRFNNKVLDDFRVTMRSTAYASQLLQRPTLEEGDMIKRSWFNIIKLSEVIKLNIKWNMIIDSAYTKNTINDPSGLMVVGKHNGDLYVRKMSQKWLQFNDLLGEIRELKTVYSIDRIYIETKASGISIKDELKRQFNYNVFPLTPLGDKIERVVSCQPQLESGRVWLVEDDWNENFLSECAAFPNGRDDQVDCLTYSINEFLKKSTEFHYSMT